MEDLILNTQNQLNNYEILSYFSCELFYVLGIVLNLFFFTFFRRKINIKRVSDFITCGVFLINSIILGSIYIKSLFFFGEFNFAIFNNSIVFSDKNILYKLLINIFMLVFVLITYKITRKARFKTPIVNSILILLAFVSSLLIQAQNTLLVYILFDLCVLLVYKFASNMRIKKDDIYCVDFVLMSLIATILFFAFYLLTYFIKDTLQLSIINVCLTCAFLLKAGFFPIYNYTLNRHYKTNIPYSVLLFCYLPLLASIAFLKFIQNANLTDEVYQITMIAFFALLIITSSIRAYKAKNIVKFLANCAYCYFGFYMMPMLFSLDNEVYLRAPITIAFCLLSLYSLVCVLKINLKPEKINISILKNIFFNNRFFAILFSILLLILVSVLPSAILKNNLYILTNIYLFDKVGIYPAFLVVIAGILILFNSIKIIKTCYSFNKNQITEKFIKRTTLNYVVPVIVMMFLIVGLFL